jgi:predicted GNAT family N-acyltransferase
MIKNVISEKETDFLFTISQVDRCVTHILNNDLMFEDLDQAIRTLESLIFDLDETDTTQVNEYLNGLSAEQKKILTDNYCKWETIHENLFAQSVLNGTVTLVEDYLLYDRFKNLITKELNLLVGFTYNSILFIGSGPFPITAILLQEFTGLVIDCLEKDEGAAITSRKVLQQLGLQDKIRIHVGDGGTYNLSSFDVVLNALLAKPKWNIMRNIKNTNVNAKVLCRTSFGLRQVIYEGTPENAFHGFREMGRQYAAYNDTISTMLVINKKGNSCKTFVKWVDNLDVQEKQKLVYMMNNVIANDNNNGFTSLLREDHIYFNILEQDLRNGLKHLLVIESDGKYMGQLVINISHVDTYRHRAEISTLMLDKAIRGKEASLMIVQEMIQRCETLGIEHLTLNVRAGSKVELLWRYFGFEIYGRLPCYSRVGVEKYEGVYMCKDVTTLKKSLVRKLEKLYV